MSNAIVVPLNEMQQLAGQWRATITEMDAMVQQIARDIASIPDNGKGLNEVRSRGRTVGSKHQQMLAQGMVVQKHVVDSVQRFSQADQELAGMVRSQTANHFADILRQNGSVVMWQLSKLGGVTNATSSDITEWLLNVGRSTNKLYGLGLKHIGILSPYYNNIAKQFSKFTNGLIDLWPTTKKKLEASKIRSREFGLAFSLVSMIKDMYASRVAVSEGNAALASGDATTAYQKFDQAYNKNLDVLATGTLALVGVAAVAVGTPVALGIGAVIGVSQAVSSLTHFGSGIARSHGYTRVADALNAVSDFTDLHSHVKSVWDAGFNAYQNPHQALKQASDFVDRSANQIKEVAGNLYQNAASWAKSWIW